MIHLYTGDGKGKTTAATGLAVRHAGSGGSVAFVQFLKSTPSGEIAILEGLPNVTVLRNALRHGFSINMSEEQKRMVTASHNENLAKARSMVEKKAVTMLVLDEVCAAYTLDLIDRAAVRDLIEQIGDVELVMTGRNPDPALLDAADYVTEMKLIRHPYQKGVPARKGVEF